MTSSTANWRGDKSFQPSKNSTWSPREITLYLLFVFNRSIARNGDDDVLDILSLDSSILGMKVQSNEGKALVKVRIWARVEGFDYAYVCDSRWMEMSQWFYEFSDQDSQVGKKETFCSGVIFCLRRNILGEKSLRRNP
ncbi:hypothetical protein Tco_0811186 [Tanacetum coccineum]